MPKERWERRTYRKSPGRQYENDPLRNQGEHNGQDEWATQGGVTRRPSAQSVQRPDPRRTRQLLRQNILAGKRVDNEEEVDTEQQEAGQYEYGPLAPRTPTRNGNIQQPHLPATRELVPNDEDEGDWQEYEENYEQGYQDVDPDIGVQEGFYDPVENAHVIPPRAGVQPAGTRFIRETPTRASRRDVYPAEEEEYYDDEYEDENEYEDEPPARRRPRRRSKKRVLTRRGLLVGLGAAAVGGTALVATEVVPRIPKAIGTAEADIQRQLEEAFNHGLAQGADNVRKEFITSLESMEGFTLAGAQEAARLTRVAYDVFVSPVIKFGSVVAADFLTAMLNAFKSGRHILSVVNQDNDTLAAIQSVLATWVAQVKNLPKQLDTITQTDLDGAQAYLRALQRKLDEEKAKLNSSNNKTNSNSTPTAQPKH